MGNTFKAIETHYSNCRFRSRIEARHAVFFDTLGIQWEYEKEGFLLEGIRYLPDFWLPEQDCWVEIKGQEPIGDELEKARLLALYTQKQVCVMYGPIEIPSVDLLNSYVLLPPTLWKFRKSEIVIGGPSATQIEVPSHILAILQGLFSHNIQFSPRPDGEIDIIPCMDVYPARDLDSLIEDLETQLDGLRQFQSRIHKYMDEIKSLLTLEEGWTYEFLSQMGFDTTCVWLECQRCGAFVLGPMLKKHHTCHDGEKGNLNQSTPRILEAYIAARSARFEFGEKGR